MELSEDAKSRIRAEEIFREEVRREIQTPAPAPTRSATLFGLLNRPFTLWVLSSVLLSGVGLVFTRWEEGRAQRAERQAQVTRLDIELSGRLQRSEHRLEFATNATGLREAIRMLDECPCTFSEFEGRSFENLLLTLSWLVPEDERPALGDARSAYRKLKSAGASEVEASVEASTQTIKWAKGQYDRGSLDIREWRR